MIIVKETFSLGFICLKMVQLNRPRLGHETLDLKFCTTLLISTRPVRFLCNPYLLLTNEHFLGKTASDSIQLVSTCWFHKLPDRFFFSLFPCSFWLNFLLFSVWCSSKSNSNMDSVPHLAFPKVKSASLCIMK